MTTTVPAGSLADNIVQDGRNDEHALDKDSDLKKASSKSSTKTESTTEGNGDTDSEYEEPLLMRKLSRPSTMKRACPLSWKFLRAKRRKAKNATQSIRNRHVGDFEIAQEHDDMFLARFKNRFSALAEEDVEDEDCMSFKFDLGKRRKTKNARRKIRDLHFGYSDVAEEHDEILLHRCKNRFACLAEEDVEDEDEIFLKYACQNRYSILAQIEKF